MGKELKRNLTLMLIAALFSFIVYLLYPAVAQHFGWKTVRTQVPVADTAQTNEKPLPEDSVEVAGGKVPESQFESQYSTEKWYIDFKINKVAFDKQYDNKMIDVYGSVDRITTSWGCAYIEIVGDDRPFDVLTFGNCPEGEDKWSDEVAQLRLNQYVHIRGKYSADLSTDYKMTFYGCHIISP